MFEAPSIPGAAVFENPEIRPDIFKGDTVEEIFTKLGILVAEAKNPRFNIQSFFQSFTPTGPWYKNYATGELDRNLPPGTQIRPPTVEPPPPPPPPPGQPQVPPPIWPPQWTLADTLHHAFDGGDLMGYGWKMTPTELAGGNAGPVGGGKASTVIQDLFAVRSTDYWDRSFLHSDGVMSALLLEALRFGKLRREGTDDIFDALPARVTLALDDHFRLRSFVNWAGGILGPGGMDYFQNSAIPLDDLQIGDQVLFETSPVLRGLGFVEWEYPTVLVTEIDTTSGSTGILNLHGVRMQGFGTPDLDLPSFQLLLAKAVDATLDNLRNYITSQPNNPPLTAMKWGAPFNFSTGTDLRDSEIFQQWNPYGDNWDAPGPWWIRLNLRTDLFYRYRLNGEDVDLLTALGQCPGGIYWNEHDKVLLFEFQGRTDPHTTIGVGAGFRPPFPPDPSGFKQDPFIFVPLNEPEGGWIAYLTDKAANPSVKYFSRLTSVHSDQRWVPGLAKELDHGKETGSGKIRVIRPGLQSSSPQP